MDGQYNSNKPSPRRELQGPRPTPLKVSKDSHKIIKNKPPLVPQQQHSSQLPHEVPQHRPPVIIYTVSPKVIHTQVSDFMSTVQRLTGFSSSSSSSSSSNKVSSSSTSSSSHVIDCVSPAARFATIDKANSIINNSSSDGDQRARLLMGSTVSSSGTAATSVIEEMELELELHERTAGSFPAGILSPVPSALPPISANFFSSSPLHVTDPNSLGFLNYDINLSPIFHGNRNYIEGTMVPSPSAAFLNSSTTTPMTSPTLSYDLFNHFLDL